DDRLRQRALPERVERGVCAVVRGGLVQARAVARDEAGRHRVERLALEIEAEREREVADGEAENRQVSSARNRGQRALGEQRVERGDAAVDVVQQRAVEVPDDVT